MSMGHTYKFFGFYISYIILTPPIYFPPIIYATYSLYLSPLSPPPNPLLIILHVSSESPKEAGPKEEHTKAHHNYISQD